LRRPGTQCERVTAADLTDGFYGGGALAILGFESRGELRFAAYVDDALFAPAFGEEAEGPFGGWLGGGDREFVLGDQAGTVGVERGD